jgi:hypothetical protein
MSNIERLKTSKTDSIGDYAQFHTLLDAMFEACKELDAACGGEVFTSADKLTAAQNSLVEYINTWAARRTQPAVVGAETERALTWGPVHTVADMVRNLLTCNQADPIHAAFHVDFEGKRRCRTRPVMISRERVIDGKWVDSARKDVPYATIVWAKQDERAAVGAEELPPLDRLEDIDLTYAIAGKLGEFYPQETPRDMEKNHRLARAIQRLPELGVRFQAYALQAQRAAIAADRQACAQAGTAQQPTARDVDMKDIGALFKVALDAEFPIPDNPHASVVQRALDNRFAFQKGWTAARQLDAAPTPDDIAQKEQQPAAGTVEKDAVVEAARKLIKAKGRFHTEQNYKALAEAVAAIEAHTKAGKAQTDKEGV